MGERYGQSWFGFEDLQVYKAARAFQRRVYGLVTVLPREEAFALGSQLRRACISITNNMAEGYGRFNWQESIQFMRIGRGSPFEVVDDLNFAQDRGYCSEQFTAELKEEARGVLQLMNGYISYLSKKKNTKA